MQCWTGAHIAYLVFGIIYVLSIYPLALFFATDFKTKSGPPLPYDYHFSVYLFFGNI